MLTEQQKEIIQNSLWIVNTVLKKQNLQHNNDWRQSALLYLCKCLERFDATKGVKWETYAYKNVFLYLKRQVYRTQDKTSISNDALFMTISEQYYMESEDTSYKELYTYVYNTYCDTIERQVLDLRLQGYTLKEVAKIMGLSFGKLTHICSAIKRKFEETKQTKEKNNDKQ